MKDTSDTKLTAQERIAQEERARVKRYFDACCEHSISEPLTLNGLENFFEHYNSPTTNKERAQYTAELLANLTRTFTSKDLQKQINYDGATITVARSISQRVGRYKWKNDYFSYSYETKADDQMRDQILDNFIEILQEQERTSEKSTDLQQPLKKNDEPAQTSTLEQTLKAAEATTSQRETLSYYPSTERKVKPAYTKENSFAWDLASFFRREK